MNKTYAFAVPGMAFDGHTIEHQSLGGSESAAYYLARNLARDNEVYLFTNAESTEKVDGVQYFPISQWKNFALTTPHDVSVIQRLPELLCSPLQSRLNLLWLHDLGIKDQADNHKGVMWNTDRIATVSGFHRQQVIDSMGLPEELVWATRNGIDTSAFEQASGRDRFRLMYAARPERGLDVLLEHVLPKIVEKEPRAHLQIVGYDNTVEQWREFYDHLKRLSEGLPVEWAGCLSKRDLYRAYASAGAYVYPTPSPIMPDFREVSCITAMECMASGLPFVSANLGALPETLDPEAGILLDANPTEDPDAWADAVVRYMQDDEAFNAASRAGREASSGHDWAQIAAEWDAEVERLVAQRNDDPERLMQHFIRRSDIEAAQYVSEKHGIVADFSPWDHGEAEYKPEHRTSEQRRGQILAEVVGDYAPGALLDFGCAQGGYTRQYAEASPDTHIVAVDLHPENIANAHRHERIEYVEGCEDDLPEERFDMAVVAEVLEHQREPWTVLEKVEKAVKPGGRIVITVPYGPWEFCAGEYWHRWEFDPHDLSDMLGDKPNRAVGYHHEGANSYSKDSFGWYMVIYDADHEPVHPIDMERKIALQCPRQTLSGCIIAGPGSEKALRLHLDSYAHLCNELIVGDTGISDEARSIFDEYGAQYVDAPNPTEVGFDKTRNTALAECTGDWVLWIDTDEHMVEPENLPKYLRENVYQGYGIRQHHFAVDTHFDADMPVRCFRRRERDGQTMRFFGNIHEHPELEMNEGPGPVVVIADVNIAHYGYMVESIRQDRFWRNLPLLKKDREDNPDRLLQKHFICRDNIILAGYILSSQGWTEQVESLCREAVETYRQYFLGNQQFLNIDTSVYYHQALEMLGEGFEFESDLVGGKRRFACREDLDAELKAALDQRLA